MPSLDGLIDGHATKIKSCELMSVEWIIGCQKHGGHVFPTGLMDSPEALEAFSCECGSDC